MKKIWISIFSLLMLLCLLVHVGMVWKFSQQQPRLEILFPQSVPENAVTALKVYQPKIEENMLVLAGENKSEFLVNEVTSILEQAGEKDFQINDRTQALRLAKQSAKMYVFGLEIIIFVCLLLWLIRDIKRLWNKCQADMEKAYFGEVISMNLELILIFASKWIFALIAAVFICARLIALEFYVPPSLLPTKYILDIGYYLELKLSAISHSGYEQMCKNYLPWLYILSLINIGFAFSAVRILRKKLKKPVTKNTRL